MRKKSLYNLLLLLFITSFIVALPLCAKTQEGNSLTLSYQMLKTSRVMGFSLSSKSFCYDIQLRQDYRDGRFTIQAPPFITANIKDKVKIGELKDDKLFSLLMSPFKTEIPLEGFQFSKNLKTISRPSQKPVLSGLAYSSENLDIISLSPVFNPMSPSALAIITGTKNVFIGFMSASQNEKKAAEIKDQYQLDWTRLGLGKNMLFSLVGASSSVNILNLDIKSTIYIQNVWDFYFAGGTACGFRLELDTDMAKIDIIKRLGGSRFKIKELTDEVAPEDSFEIGLTLSNTKNKKIILNYKCDTYDKPIYGGFSQKCNIKLETKISYKDFKLNMLNTTSYEVDSGKVSRTEYAFSFDDYLDFSFALNRGKDNNPYACDAKLKLDIEKAALEIKGSKVLLEFTWEIKLSDMNLSLSINQDRIISAKLKLINI